MSLACFRGRDQVGEQEAEGKRARGSARVSLSSSFQSLDSGGARSGKIAANRALRDGALADLKQIAYAETKTEFQDLWDNHIARHSDQPEWIKYLSTQWYPVRKRWACAWKQVRLRRF
jgi:hypothetical protein